jgi:hypothetical protein
MQEQQSVTTFVREKSIPCNPGLYRCPRYLPQQQFDKQFNTTPRQQGRSTSVRFFVIKHQFDPIVQWKNQHHGQPDKILHHQMQMLGTLQYTLYTKNTAKKTTVITPKVNGQIPETSAPTDRHNPQNRDLLQQETDIENQTTGQKQQGNITTTDRKRIQMEIYVQTGSAQTFMKYPSDLLAVVPQNTINYTLAKDIKYTHLHERKEDRQDFNEIRPDTTKPENTIYGKDFPPLQTSYEKDFPPLRVGTTSIPPTAQSPPTIVEVKYVPSLPDQINFHLTRRTWYETTM